jgi:Icc protein
VRSGTLIAQVTDCHLKADAQQLYRGINPYENLKMLLNKVKRIKPDLLLASGDLSEDGDRAAYAALQHLFKSLGIPVLALPGNHDDAEQLAETFPGSPVDSVEVTAHGPWQIIRLNSSLPGKTEGRLSEKVLLELESLLANQPQCPRLIAVHHQPIIVGSPWIDKYRLFDAQRFLQLIDQYPDIKAVVWGHIHQVFETDRNGTAMLGGPSSATNSLPGVQNFTADSSGPACRWLELLADGTIRYGIISVS